MKSFNVLIIAIVVAVVATLSGGTTAALAEPPAAAPNQAAQEALAKQKSAADAVEARRLRDEAWQRRKEMRDFVEQVRQGQQPGPGAAAPGNSGGGK